MIDFPASPFGTEITSEDIVATMQQFKGWEDRYRQVIQWGKKLPQMPEELKSEQVTYQVRKLGVVSEPSAKWRVAFLCRFRCAHCSRINCVGDGGL